MTPVRDCCELILCHACDLACRFCSQGDFDPAARMSAAEAARRIYEAKKLGYKRLGFSGGEALLRPDLPALAAAARKVGFRTVRLQTNGMKLADPALCKKLAGAGLTVCKFTFLGADAKTHDALTGRRGSFCKSLAGLDNMLALKLAVGVNLLVSRGNYRKLKDILRFFMDRGVSTFVLIYPIYVGNMRRNHRALGVSLPEASPRVSEALSFAEAAGLGGGVKALNMPPCMLPGHEEKSVALYKFNTVVASADGGLRDLDDTSSAGKKHGPPCRACLFRRRCPGMDENYLSLFGWRGFAPVKKVRAAKPAAAGPGYLGARERCFLETLRTENNIPTKRVLELARRLPLCQDCRDGAAALATGGALLKKGLVARTMKKGVYYWSLKNA